MKIFKALKTFLSRFAESVLSFIEGKPSYEIWTDASFHDNAQNIGCAAYIQENGQEPYVLVSSIDRGERTVNINLAEFQAIAMVLEHVGEDSKLIKWHSDSDAAINYVRYIQGGTLDSEYLEINFADEIDVIARQRRLRVEHVSGNKADRDKNNPINLADEFAYYARKESGADLTRRCDALAKEFSIHYVLK